MFEIYYILRLCPYGNWEMMLFQEQIQQRIICPGQVTSLTCSPDGVYVVGAVQEKILVWQVLCKFQFSTKYIWLAILVISDFSSFIIKLNLPRILKMFSICDKNIVYSILYNINTCYIFEILWWKDVLVKKFTRALLLSRFSIVTMVL